MAIEPFLGTRWQQGFLLTVIIQAIAVLTMVAISFGIVHAYVDLSEGGNRTIPCYFAMFALAELYEVLMTLDALKLRNVIQLIGINIFHLCMIVFASLQPHQTRDALVTNPNGLCSQDYAHCSGVGSLYHRVLPFFIVSPCILAASLIVLIYFTWRLYYEFGWVVFHVVGANIQMKTMYTYYQILICLLKFDYFIFTAVTMQLLILVLTRSGAEFPLTIIAIPVVLFLITFCIIAVKREIKWLMTICLILMLGAQAYFVYKFVRLWTPNSREAYVSTRATLAVFLIIAFLLLFASFAVGLKCFLDFDKDLKPAKNRDYSFDKQKRRGSTYTKDTVQSSGQQMVQTPGGDQGTYDGGAQLEHQISIE